MQRRGVHRSGLVLFLSWENAARGGYYSRIRLTERNWLEQSRVLSIARIEVRAVFIGRFDARDASSTNWQERELRNFRSSAHYPRWCE